MWRHSQKLTVWKPEREPSPAANYAKPLIWDFQPLIFLLDFCCFTHPVYSILLWKSGHTRTPSYGQQYGVHHILDVSHSETSGVWRFTKHHGGDNVVFFIAAVVVLFLKESIILRDWNNSFNFNLDSRHSPTFPLPKHSRSLFWIKSVIQRWLTVFLLTLSNLGSGVKFLKVFFSHWKDKISSK